MFCTSRSSCTCSAHTWTQDCLHTRNTRMGRPLLHSTSVTPKTNLVGMGKRWREAGFPSRTLVPPRCRVAVFKALCPVLYQPQMSPRRTCSASARAAPLLLTTSSSTKDTSTVYPRCVSFPFLHNRSYFIPADVRSSQATFLSRSSYFTPWQWCYFRKAI